MKWLVNGKADVVADAVRGLLNASGTRLAVLDGFPERKVVLRADWKKDRVALVSGGGSGHEPAHAGFVGEGMLTAAVVGEIFASPSVDAVFQAIVAVTGNAGCLLIVKNYTGDRLNFGLAAERARALGFKVEMVIVSDDAALPDNPQPRGLAGTLFVHKIAGAAAAAGKSLAEVASLASAVALASASYGLAFETCSIPGMDKERRLGDDHVELGLGIHGEPGASLAAMASADELVARIAQELARSTASDRRYAMIVNNLGGLTPIEMQVATAALAKTSLWRQVDLLIGPAPLMTSLDMRGLSLSILALSDDYAELLSRPVSIPSWIEPTSPGAFSVAPATVAPASRTWQPSANAAARKILLAGLEAVEAAEAELNALDARVGDGDTGSTLAVAARHVKAGEQALPYASTADLLGALADATSKAMGGSSGVLLAIFFTAASKASEDGSSFADSLLAGLAAMKMYGGAEIGHRTMIDALEPALQALAAGKSMAEVEAAAAAGAESTKDMVRARSGRSSYVGEDRLRGHVDPGAQAVAIVFAAIARVV